MHCNIVWQYISISTVMLRCKQDIVYGLYESDGSVSFIERVDVNVGAHVFRMTTWSLGEEIVIA